MDLEAGIWRCRDRPHHETTKGLGGKKKWRNEEGAPAVQEDAEYIRKGTRKRGGGGLRLDHAEYVKGSLLANLLFDCCYTRSCMGERERERERERR